MNALEKKEIIKNFWERFNDRREWMELTSNGIGQLIGRPARYLSTQKHNNKLPYYIDGQKIADALETTVEYLLGGDESKDPILNPYYSDCEALINDIKTLPPEEQDLVSRICLAFFEKDNKQEIIHNEN